MDTTTEQLLEDRRNGMGLQKAAKKYGMGIARIRKIEAENGMGRELVPAKLFVRENQPVDISAEDMRRHFQEVQDSFAIALEEIQKTKEELLQKIELLSQEDFEMLEELDEKIDTQIDQQWVSIGVGVLGFGFFLYTFLHPPKPEIRWIEQPRKSRIPDME